MTGGRRLPYPGLRAFTREESDLFFGREGCVDAMVDRLAATRFLAVLGPSGSGKSSLVRTGLLDALDLGLHPWAGSRWKIADLHPGGCARRSLAAALLEAKTGAEPDDGDVDLLTTFLGAGPRSVVEWASGGNLPQACNLLILADQFEELFRYGDYAQREEAEAFVTLLIESASAAGAPIHVVITMRSEYLGACALMPGLAEHINAGLYLTPRMGREECKLAIEGPASVMGFKVEPALVNRLLNDLASFAPWEAGERADQAERLSRQADQLPLMQHVLNRLWARALTEGAGRNVVLKLADYEQLGGLSGALDAHGAEVMEALGPARAGLVEDVFRALISGTSVELAVRRPSRLGELVEVAGGARRDVATIVEAFRAPDCSFMRTSVPSLASDDTIVDISHESLIRQWTPLREWLRKEARAGTAWRRLVNAEERYAQGEGGLLTGLDLHTLVAWWESANPTRSWAARQGGRFEEARAFLEASRSAEAAQADAERQRQLRERQRLRWGVVGLATALSIVTLLGVSTLVTRNQLRDSYRQLSAKNDSLNQQTAAANQARDSANKARDSANEARDSANKARDEANQMHEMADLEAKRTASVLDRVSNVVYSDSYRFLAGLEEVQEHLMRELVPYQRDISKEHATMIGQDRLVRDEYRLGTSLEKLGDARRAMEKYAAAYERGRAAIAALPKGHPPTEELAVNFLEDGYRYSWFLADIGKSKEGEDVLHGMESLMARYESQASTVPMLVAYARLEALENRYDADHERSEEAIRHLTQAHQLATLAAAKPDTSMDALRLLSLYSRALAFKVEGARQEELRKTSCAVGEEMMRKNPMDTRAILERVDCLTEQANREWGKDDLKSAQRDYQEAHDILYRALQIVPHQQSLLMALAGVDTDFASFWAKRDDARQKQLILEAKKCFVDAVKGKTLFQAQTGQVRRLYSSLKDIDLPMDPNKEVTYSSAEVEFYKDIADAVAPAVEAFPTWRDFAYVEADASKNVGQLLAKDPTQAHEAETYLSRSIDSLDRSGFIDDTSHFSQDFATYCRSYAQRVEMYASLRRAEPMVADVKKLMTACAPLLEKNKYPFDLYMRWNIVLSNRRAGQVLFDMQRYQDALPYLEYASHWADSDASKLLARMYQEGLGVKRDERKARETEVLARKQSIKVVPVPVSSGSTKTVDFYILQWPAEYPYQGIDDQVKWLKEVRNTKIDSKYVDEFQEYQKYAREHDLSVPEWSAFSWNNKEVEPARKKYSAEPTVANFKALRTAFNNVYDPLIKLDRQGEANVLQKELIDTAEQLLKQSPGTDSYRAALDFFEEHGDRVKEKNPADARKDFTRCVELADLLPRDNASDLHRRMLSYERLADIYAVESKHEDARVLYVKEVEAARQKYTLESNADNLEAVKIGTYRLYNHVNKLKRQADTDALRKELAGIAEEAVKKSPGAATYRVAFDMFLSVGDTEKEKDAAAARQAFTRAAEVAELLPEDNVPDLRRRFFSYERIGSLDADRNKTDAARSWYTKEVNFARKAYARQTDAEGLDYLRKAANHLITMLTKLRRQTEADTLQSELTAKADDLLRKTASAACYRVVWDILTDQADRLRSRDPQQARQVFVRSLAMADLLPDDNSSDVYKRLLCAERLGDLDAAADKSEEARAWYAKEYEAAQKRYGFDNIPSYLESMHFAAKRLSRELIKLKRQEEADTLQKRLAETAEKLIKKSPSEATYRVASEIFTAGGYVLKASDRAAARRAYLRASEVAELLPEDNGNDLFTRVIIDQALGDDDSANEKPEEARTWYTKECEAARKRFAMESTADSYESLRIALSRLTRQLVKMKQQARADALWQEFMDSGEALLARSPSQAILLEVVRGYAALADEVSGGGDQPGAQQRLMRARELVHRFAKDTPDGLYWGRQELEVIGDSLRQNGAPAEARATYQEATLWLEKYVALRSGTPRQRAAADENTLDSIYGTLSFISLLGGDFVKSLDAARHGLEIDPSQAWIEQNMAHGLLMSGKQDEAIKHYMNVRKAKVSGRSMLAATREDFEILKSLGLGNPAMDSILKQMAED